MSAAQMFDAVAALIVVALGLIGFLRGFISAVMSFVSLSCGTYSAWKFSSEGTSVFIKYFPNVDESIASIIAMAIIFFSVALVISLISKLLCSLISFAKLSGINHLTGLLMGLATGFAIIIAAYGVITLLAPEVGQGWMELSIFMNLAEKVWPYVHSFLMSHGFLNSTKPIIKAVV
jgi:uncharacterized membrane protein required for colicin V production